MIMKVLIYLIFVYSVVVSREHHRNNVCPTNLDYNNKIFNKKCWYNSDVDLSVSEIIKKYGYPYEEHQIITDDGYKLPLYRIPHGINVTISPTKILQPVFLLHGVFCTSAPFVTFGNKSIAFQLADKGYDVWLANSRGSTYGKAHVNLSVHDTKFWNYSFHEIAVYDIPKSLDLIYNKTGRNDTIFIGQSMGTNIQLVYASELQEHAKQRVKFMVYLGPTAFLLNLKTFIAGFAYLWPELYEASKILGVGEIFSKKQLPTPLNTLICTESGIQALACEIIVMSIMGYDLKNFPPEVLPVMMGHFPAGTSVKTAAHLAQNLVSKRFCKFDYGHKHNEKVYNSSTPPYYNMSKVAIPGVIMYGVNDYLATLEGVAALYKALPTGSTTLYEIKDRDSTHMDFFYSKVVLTEVINPMLSFMNEYKTTTFVQSRTTGN